jgi:hypothetical protein
VNIPVESGLLNISSRRNELAERRRVSKARNILLAVLVCIAVSGAVAQSRHDFSGSWKQSNERSVPKRNGGVTLRIDHRDPQLTVETSIQRASAPPRHALQRYTTDGKVSTSTGADGDEFHTSVVRAGDSLVFTIEEHEDDRIILSKETWTLIEDGKGLQRIREFNGGQRQTLIYLRQPPQP